MPALKRFVKTTLVLLALVAIGVFWLQHSVSSFMSTPMSLPDNGLVFEIPAGSSFADVTGTLREAGAIDSERWYQLYARYTEQSSRVQAGEYLLAAGTTPLQALQQFTSGSVRLHSFTIIEGWNHRDLLAALGENDNLKATMTVEDWPALLQSLGAETTHPEGLFLPETYRFPQGTTDRQLLAQAYQLMQKTLAAEWENRGDDAPVKSPYETLILASIVEKETARADERARIAGVFARRLEKRMRLQTDPTVIYGLGTNFDGNITRKHLRTDTPYNTYTRHGLPPTPIAMPGRAAIRAALNPEQGDTLFFVATGLGDGSHAFSRTKEEHDAAVAEYLKRLRARRNKGR